MMRFAGLVAAGLAAGLFACSGGDESGSESAPRPATAPGTPAVPTQPESEKAAEPAPKSPAELAMEGRSAYLTNCAACHNADPRRPGSLGPEVAGASLELLERRVIHGDYPAGYTPKRDSKAMVAMPFLEAKLPAIAAFLDGGSE